MSKKKIKSREVKDINFTLTDLDGDPVEFSLVPLKQWVAAEVFHNVLTVLLNALGGAFGEGDEQKKIKMFIDAATNVLTFEKVRFLIEKMMNGAMVDDIEVDIDGMDVFEENPHFIYLVLFHGVKGNWPNVFSKLGAKGSGFFSKVIKEAKAMTDTEAEAEV